MHYFIKLWVDFIFPKSSEMTMFENMTAEEIYRALPKARIDESKEVMALFDYKDVIVKKFVREIKYQGNKELARAFGVVMYDCLVDKLAELSLSESAVWLKQRPIIIPVPVSNKRLFERGWNQSEIICREILRHDKDGKFEYIPGALAKSHHTESQTKTASRSERLENLKNSMNVPDGVQVAERCVVVIDDVTTTGATFSETRRALRAAGANKVLCVALAH